MTEERLKEIKATSHTSMSSIEHELLEYVDALRAEFTTDISLDRAFQELFALGAEFKIPEFVLRDWKFKWLDRHLRFHHEKEKTLNAELAASQARVKRLEEALRMVQNKFYPLKTTHPNEMAVIETAHYLNEALQTDKV